MLEDGFFPFHVNILQLIERDRLNNPESYFYFPIGDERNKYIFPSKAYGRKIKGGTSKNLYLLDPGATWGSALKMGGVARHMKIHSTRHSFATNFAKTLLKTIQYYNFSIGETIGKL